MIRWFRYRRILARLAGEWLDLGYRIAPATWEQLRLEARAEASSMPLLSSGTRRSPWPGWRPGRSRRTG